MTFTALSTISARMEPKEAGHWVAQLLKLFPQAAPPTSEMVAAMVTLVCQHSRETVSKTFSPDGIPSKFNFLPSLKEIKDALDDVASAPVIEAHRQRQLKEQLEERNAYAPQKPRGEYWGPIEEVKPGDVLPFSRFSEYDKFMREKKGIQKVKHYTFTEEWKDNGQRPFQVKLQEEKQEENPFG